MLRGKAKSDSFLTTTKIVLRYMLVVQISVDIFLDKHADANFSPFAGQNFGLCQWRGRTWEENRLLYSPAMQLLKKRLFVLWAAYSKHLLALILHKWIPTQCFKQCQQRSTRVGIQQVLNVTEKQSATLRKCLRRIFIDWYLILEFKATIQQGEKKKLTVDGF